MSNLTENDMNTMTEEIAEDTTKDMYLTFEIDNEEYGIDVVNVKEIIPVCGITLVPHTPNYVKGIINLRGDIIPVIGVRSRFGKPEIAYTELTCIVVIEYEEYVLGLIVDCVKGVLIIPSEDISAPPSAKLSFRNQFVKEIGTYEGQIKLLLDLSRLLAE